ncbi:DUF945 family protein [Marinobacter sp. 1Y8]
MNKWIFVGIIFIATAVGAPYGTGLLTEQEWAPAVERLNAEQPYMQVQTTRYQRHFFSSDIEGEVLLINPETGETAQVGFVGDVSHGIAGSSVELTPVTDGHELLQKLFPEELPRLALQTWLWGTLEADLNVPAINVTDEDTGETLNAAEAYGWAEVSDGGDQFEVNLRWPGLTVRGDDLKIAFDDFEFSQDAERVVGEVWSGEGHMVLGRVEIKEGSRPHVELHDLEITGETDPQSGNERLSSQSTVSLESIKVDDRTFGPHKLELALENVNVEAWNQFLTVIADVQSANQQMDPGKSPEELFRQKMLLAQQLSGAARWVAGSGIKVGMPVIKLETPEGSVDGHWQLSHPEVPEDERDAMPLVMQQMTGELELTVPVALIEKEPSLIRQVQGLVQQGLIVQDGDRYKIKASLNDMMLDINGNQMSVPPLI